MAITNTGYDIWVHQFDHGVDIEFALTNEDGTPFDLTGYTAQFIVKKNKSDDDSQAIDDLLILSDFTDNVIRVPIDKDLTENAPGMYCYAIRLYKGGDFVNTVVQAKFNILDNTFESGVAE